MKNIIIIDIDTERVPVIKIGKTEDTELPKDNKEAKEFVLKDMGCITEALATLINAADQSNIRTTEESLNDIIIHLRNSTSSDDRLGAKVLNVKPQEGKVD